MAMLIAAVAMVGCGHSHEHATEHEHDENLQLTAYNDDFEVYAEVTPLAVGEESEVLAHFTHLCNFKPIEKGKMTVTLAVGTETVSQTLEEPTRTGIYKFAITPKKVGEGRLMFDVVTKEGRSQLVVQNVMVYKDKHDAQHAAADAKVSSSNGVSFIKEKSWKVDFSTVAVKREAFGQVIRTMAQVQPSQGDERVVTAKASGIVTIADASLVEGKTVSAGQVLCRIETSELADNNLAVRYSEIVTSYNLAKQEYERKQELAKDNIVTQSELLRAKADYEKAEAVYRNLQKNFASGSQSATAPIAGFVKQLMVRNGQFVEAGAPIATVSQNRNLLIKAEVQSKYYPMLSQIASATFTIPNGESVTLESLNGKLVSYGKSTDVNSPLLPVVFQVDNLVNLLPGAFVEMYIKTQGETSALTVPNVSLCEEMGNYFVYVQLTPEYFEKREVRIGQTDGMSTEILSGLKEGERVVAKGAVLVKLSQQAGSLNAESGHVH